MNYEIGSMWRKWDLHVHTPFSILNNQFGSDFDNYFYNLFTKAIENEIVVIGVTDYYSIKGYKKVIEYLSNDEKLKSLFKNEIANDSNYINKIKNITIMPNIEFRLNSMINSTNKNDQSKFQIHVVFSNDVSVNDIDTQFLNSISFNDGKKEVKLTKDAVIKYGREMIDSGTCQPNDTNPEYVGYNQISFDLKEIVNRLQNYFNGKYIIVGVEEDITNLSWKNQGGSIRKNYYENCDAVFSSNPKSIKWFSSEDAVITIKKKKACIWGSDSHSINDLFKPYENRYCWIKADTTFTGLKFAINSINERVYIGEIPTELAEANLRRNYSIASVYISRNSNINMERKWFNMNKEILLNPYMVTIIGNKGSGKSALADIISYLENSYKLDKASFLNNQRFLKANTKYYENFKANMKMCGDDHIIIEKNRLYNDFDLEKSEIVQFLPQKYIEDVCNDLDGVFQEEIDNVIYSYVQLEKKLDSTNLNDLIDKMAKNIKNNITSKRVALSNINDSIVTLENKCTFSYKQKINNQLRIQNERLKNHDANKPSEVEKPSDLENDFYSKLDVKLSNNLNDINEEIYKEQKEQSEIYKKLIQISDFEDNVKHFILNLKDINNQYDELKKLLSINNEKDYISYKINTEELAKKKTLLLNDYNEHSEILSDNFDRNVILSLVSSTTDYEKIIENLNKIKSLYAKNYYIDSCRLKFQNLASEKSRKYLQYQLNYGQWFNTRKMITGDIPNTIDGESIKKYKDEIDYIEKRLPADLQMLKDRRKEIIVSICEEFENLRETYKNIYAPIQNKIDAVLNNKKEKVEFMVNVSHSKDLSQKIISYMNQRVASNFRGVVEGNDRINLFIKETDFNDKNSIIEFITKMYDETEQARDLNAFISERSKYYSFIGSLDYLDINYMLTLNGKSLLELSPGERGIVLLVFYLALSKSNLPLIIDQPEDNLDNQSIYERLVPCIKTAKKNRQIIVVTHNPNIAVACDSEQIIYASMNKKTGEISYQTGSLENPTIREKVVDILEGTMPAFDLRRLKYLDKLN